MLTGEGVLLPIVAIHEVLDLLDKDIKSSSTSKEQTLYNELLSFSDNTRILKTTVN